MLFAGTKADLGLTAILTKASEQISRTEEMKRYEETSRLGQEALEKEEKKGGKTSPKLKATGRKARQTIKTWPTRGPKGKPIESTEDD